MSAFGGKSDIAKGIVLRFPLKLDASHNDPTACGTKKTAEQRTDAIFEYSQIFQKTACACLCHRRHRRCDRCFRNSASADRVGSGSRNSAAAFHGAGPAVVAIAGTSSGGHSGFRRTSILAAGGWSDCCPGHSSAEV